MKQLRAMQMNMNMMMNGMYTMCCVLAWEKLND